MIQAMYSNLVRSVQDVRYLDDCIFPSVFVQAVESDLAASANNFRLTCRQTPRRILTNAFDASYKDIGLRVGITNLQIATYDLTEIRSAAIFMTSNDGMVSSFETGIATVFMHESRVISASMGITCPVQKERAFLATTSWYPPGMEHYGTQAMTQDPERIKSSFETLAREIYRRMVSGEIPPSVEDMDAAFWMAQYQGTTDRIPDLLLLAASVHESKDA
ncbi:hypothetical protein GF351_04245 [Candidatus Woesearchaeota archaeon]|nr:hypothetical protein [Candidatus Woesearchaeota archaeon]